MFSQASFDGAIQAECMSSEESDGEEPDPECSEDHDGSPVQVLRTRGPPWRSARLCRFYMILDEHVRLERSGKARRGPSRRIRREGPPKDGLILPPKGVARWMVSKRWLQEAEALGRIHVAEILRDHIVDPTEAEMVAAREMLGPDDSDVEEEAASSTVTYAHVSDRSYSLYNALQPV